MSSIFPSMGDATDSSDGYREFSLTYRHWLVVSLLILMNVVIFGCVLLAAFGKIRVGF